MDFHRFLVAGDWQYQINVILKQWLQEHPLTHSA